MTKPAPSMAARIACIKMSWAASVASKAKVVISALYWSGLSKSACAEFCQTTSWLPSTLLLPLQ